MLIILSVQGVLLYGFYNNEYLLLNFKIAYLNKIYLPSFAYSLNKNVSSVKDSYLASALAIFQEKSDSDVLADNSQNGSSAKSIPVLLYHGIIDKPDGANVLLEDFKDQMFALKKAGWQTITLEGFSQFIKGEKELPNKSFLLTFDDGRKDSYYPVDPILKALDYNAVIFVITKYSLEDKSGNYYLSKRELERMTGSGRWEIEAHTREGHNIYKISQDGQEGHYYSNKLWIDNESRLETKEEFTSRITSDFVAAKNDIEQGLGAKVMGFAYPFGDFGQDSANFPESELMVSDIVKSIYLLSFYQVWPGKGFSFNYPAENQFLIKRIEVRPYWNSDNLLKVLNTAKEKNLPYFDDFSDYKGWAKNYGKLSIENNSMIMGSRFSNGSLIFLDGSYLWEDYFFKSKIKLLKGQTFSLLARYNGDNNYVSCEFTPEFIRIERVIEGKRELVYEKKDNFVFIGKDREVGIRIKNNTVDCYINGKVVTENYDIKNIPKHGGIGFRIWDPEINNSEIIIKKVSVEETN